MDHQKPPHKLVETICLVGTPNSGKTSLFNALSGLNQRVGNFPGVTVERKSTQVTVDKGRTAQLIDLPGTDSLYPSAEDEAITCEILRNPTHPDYPDKVVVVADVTQLQRGIMLCTQVMDLGFPTILVLNMMDLVEQKGINLDITQLESWLGIPVLGISALKKSGLKQLKNLLLLDIDPPERPFMAIPSGLLANLNSLQERLNIDNPYLAFQALVHPGSFSYIDRHILDEARDEADLDEDQTQKLISNELLVRLDRIEGILEESMQTKRSSAPSFTDRLDRILTHKVWGYLIFVILLVLIFQAIFSWATFPMDLIDGWVESLKEVLTALLPAHWLTDLLTEGIVTGFGGIIIFIPQIAFLFFFIALMEESGYMSRVVFLMDRIMRPFGFSGKSIIPLMGGMACAIPSIMMSRNIPHRVERLITILVTPIMSCSARIPVYTLLIAMFIPAQYVWGFDLRGLYMTALYFFGFFMALLMAFAFKKLFKYQANQVFVMEMPLYRIPRWRNVGLTVYQKSLSFVFGAGKIILSITIILWFLVAFGPGDRMDQIDQQYDAAISQLDGNAADSVRLETERASAKLESSYAAYLGKTIEPVIRPLGFDWKIGISLITSFAAREVFVGTMSIIYQQDDPEGFEAAADQERGRLGLIQRMRTETYPDTGKPVYTPAVVFSLIVFYAIAMQCMSTLAVTRKEAGWKWMWVMLAYLTILAYLASLITYQVMA